MQNETTQSEIPDLQKMTFDLTNEYSNLESVLHKLNDFVTLEKSDRRKYTDDFNTVRDFLLREMMNIDENFRTLYSGPYLAGSYADNLKVSKPDEFHLVFHLKAPDHRLINVHNDPDRPGNVLIDMYPLLKKIETEQQNQKLYYHFCNLINKDAYLIPAKLQSWIESLFTKVLKNCSNTYKFWNGEVYEMYYVKTGPAHTIIVTQGSRPFSIDFVPGLLFDGSKWPGKRLCPTYARYTNWIAVPKPINGWRENLSFQSSFVDTEREIIRGKYDMKNTLRMFKKMRDKLNIQNLKSYYIKTVFLWQLDNLPSDYWEVNTLSDVFLHMFEAITGVLESGNLPFYWDRDCNMFGNLTYRQLNTMHAQWKAAYCYCLRYKDTEPRRLFELFLTDEEQRRMKIEPIQEDWSCVML